MKTTPGTLVIIIILCLLSAAGCGSEPGTVPDQFGQSILPIAPPDLSAKTVQTEIKSTVDLFDSSGTLKAYGWARRPLIVYNRAFVKADTLRVKEWEHYTFFSEDFAGAVTISDIGSLAFGSMELIDIKNKRLLTSPIKIVRPGTIGLPSSAEEQLVFESGSTFVSMQKEGSRRLIRFQFNNENPDEKISGALTLKGADGEGLAIITPYAEKDFFFYEYKMPAMTVEGTVNYAGKDYSFLPQSSYAVLDWGRGAWPQQNRWLWGAGSGFVDGELLSFNLGYGFGEARGTTENGVVYRGKVHKLDRVRWIYDINDYMKPWKFTSNDGRFEMDFQPVYLLHSDLKLKEMLGFFSQLYENFSLGEIWKLLATKAYLNKAFGYYSGTIILDNGNRIKVEKMFGFAEQMYQTW